MPEETKATFTVDLSPVVQLIQDVKDDVRGVRNDVGTLSQKVAEVSVDHAQRITRTEDRLDTVEKRVTVTETKHDVLEKRVVSLEVAEAKDGAVEKIRGRQHTNWQWRITTAVASLMGLSGWAILVWYLVQ